MPLFIPSRSDQIWCYLLLIASLIFVPIPSQAVSPPDAGRLLGDITNQPTIQPRQQLPEIKINKIEAATPQGARLSLEVKSFQLSGNRLVPLNELQPIVDRNAGRTLDFAGLQQVIAELNAYYRQRGYLTSYAYLPTQDVTAGHVQVNLVEGLLANPGIKFKGDDSFRLDEIIALGVLRTAIPEGEVITQAAIERGLLLLNDLPGIRAQSTLVPGASAGTSELLVEASETRLFSGSLAADNFGGRYTGKASGTGSIALNNPTGHGDLFGLRYMRSVGDLNYLRTFYQLPINRHITTVGLAVATMDYSLGEEFENDNIKGNSKIYSVYLTHPLIRSRNLNLNFSANLDQKKLKDEAAGVLIKERGIKLAKLSLSGNLTDQLYNVGVTNFGITLTRGSLDLSKVPGAMAADAVTAQTDGVFNLVSANLSHTRYLPQNLSLFVAVQGQSAYNNLDSSEKISLGGPSGVRAYTQGEANGDHGYVLNAELRYDLNQLIPKHQLQTYLFIDQGHIWLNDKIWTGWQGSNPSLDNSYRLSGVGLGFALAKSSQYFVRASYAWPIGGNDGADTAGNDSEGQNANGQFWLQAAYWF